MTAVTASDGATAATGAAAAAEPDDLHVEVQFSCDFDEFLEAANAVRPWKQVAFNRFMLTWLPVMAGLGWIALMPESWVIGAVVIAVAAVLRFYMIAKRRARLRKQFSVSRLDLSTTATLDRHGIVLVNNHGKIEKGWHEFAYSMQTRNLILLFVRKGAFTIVPKRAFNNNTKRERLHAIMEARMDSLARRG